MVLSSVLSILSALPINMLYVEILISVKELACAIVGTSEFEICKAACRLETQPRVDTILGQNFTSGTLSFCFQLSEAHLCYKGQSLSLNVN